MRKTAGQIANGVLRKPAYREALNRIAGTRAQRSRQASRSKVSPPHQRPPQLQQQHQ